MKNPYLRMARVDHWFKNIFMVPGFLLAGILADVKLEQSLLPIVIALISTCLVASANYVINEWLDAEFDRHHPVKNNRPVAMGSVNVRYVILEYILLCALGLLLAALLTREFVAYSAVLLVMGVLYNVPPVRLKDRSYLDVLSESLNNPLRLLLGWFTLVTGSLPPSSILVAYWMGGAFLMDVKRFSEFRLFGDLEKAALYRRSFRHYTELKLLLAAFFYAITSAFFLAIFLIKYRIELLLSFPLFAILFVWYLAIGMEPDSPAQYPEKLYRRVGFMAYVIFLAAFVALLFFVDIPWLQIFVERLHY